MGQFVIERDVVSGQTKGCAIAIQVRYTRFLWMPKWAFKRDAAMIHIDIAAPVHDPERGYRCLKWAIG